jgi:hypothetical protein
MKSFIKISIATLFVFVATTTYSQKKVTETTLKVDGVCFMCKNRIESALDTVGVKFATWDIDTKILKVAFRNDKYTVNDISQILANVGHDTEEIKATEEVYSKIDKCCKYRDPAVVEDHNN